METIRSIVRGNLPPVGNRIKLGPRSQCKIVIEGYHANWVNSGTSALALALIAAKNNRPHIAKPQVIIPGYGCPDLVSACVFAGCTAKLVDLRIDGWGLDPQQLKHALSENTLAVIGVNFLGIKEDWPELHRIINQYNPAIVTIEDSAQWFPDLNQPHLFTSDYVVFSFGKGKPLSLLSGGALFSQKPIFDTYQSNVNTQQPPSNYRMLQMKYFLFNQILHPNIYWLLNNNPIFRPGKTVYKHLNAISQLDPSRLELLQANYQGYLQNLNDSWRHYDNYLSNINFENRILPKDSIRIKNLLRYPLACDSQSQRDNLLTALKNQGLGATALYQQALIDLDCPKQHVDTSLPQTQSRLLASKLITLPCHSGVKSQHLEQITRLLNSLQIKTPNTIH